MKKISLTIVTYNSDNTIKSCLESVLAESNEMDVVVVDNISTDKTVQIVKTFSTIRLIKSEKNLGFGAANNLGVRNSKSEYLLFLNPDAKVEKGSIGKLSEYLDTDKDTAVVGPKLQNEDGSIQQEMAKFPTLFSQTLILLRMHRLPFFSKFVYPEFDYTKTQEAEHLMGAALMVRRSVFEEVAGFDENFFLWFEETDLLKRIKDKGYKVIYNPDAVVTHLAGQSTKKIPWFRKQTIWNRSLIYYFSKHKSFLYIVALLPFILLSYLTAFITNLLKR